jgi:precorrin-2 dehydrogenase / sirohydrochlorin ferrochelatase
MEDPVFAIGVKLKGRRVVFAGAGAVAERKLMRLLTSGAMVTVIAPVATPMIEAMAGAGQIVLERRGAEPQDFDETFLAFIATNDDEANARLTEAARQRGALVNRADEAEDCDFVLPALSWMNTVHIGVFSGSPALSKWIRRHLEQTLGPDFPEFAGAFGKVREHIRQTGLPQEVRAEILTRLLNEGLYSVYRTSGMKAAMSRAERLVEEYRKKPSAADVTAV